MERHRTDLHFMPTTHKKVIVRKLDRDSMHGYVAQIHRRRKGRDPEHQRNAVAIDLKDIKAFTSYGFGDSESVTRKTFAGRPRTEGLWVRLEFRDKDMLEGMMPNDLAQLTPEGYFVNPPDTRANTQRVFVPRTALTSLTVLGVIGGPQARRRKAEDARQVTLFSE